MLTSGSGGVVIVVSACGLAQGSGNCLLLVGRVDCVAGATERRIRGCRIGLGGVSPSVVVGVVALVDDMSDDDDGMLSGMSSAGSSSPVDCVGVPSEFSSRGRFRSCLASSITSAGMTSPVCLAEGGGFRGAGPPPLSLLRRNVDPAPLV